VQAFSYLQRNITDKNYIKLIFIGAIFVAYVSVSVLNPYMPPLLGVLIATAYFVQKKEFMWFALVYLLIFEADRGYYLFSSWFFLFFCIYYLIPFVSNFLDCKRCIAAFSALAAYPLYYIFLSMIDGFLLKDTVAISFTPLFVCIFFETLFALSLE
jgi:hypothetical protein